MTNNEDPQSQSTKKTRELPNLSECHCCHLRVDIANASAKSKLHILYSEWRVVLLCKKCLSRVESSELCSYCFAATSPSQEDSFNCCQCNRRVHRHCDSEYRGIALLSQDSCLAVEVGVCADCWLPESLARWRGVMRSQKARRGGKGRACLGLGKYRVSAVLDGRTICDVSGAEEGSKDAAFDVDDDDDDDSGHLAAMNSSAKKLCSPNLSVCVCDSSTGVGCLKLDIEEENEDDDGLLIEGQGSSSNGVDALNKQELDECVCVTTPKDKRRNSKLDPFYFKYRKRSMVNQSVNTCLNFVGMDDHVPAITSEPLVRLSPEKDGDPMILLKVQSQQGSVISYMTGLHMHLKHATRDYCRRLNVSFEVTRFLYDGRRVQQTDTPAKLEMEEDDAIDAMVDMIETMGHNNGVPLPFIFSLVALFLLALHVNVSFADRLTYIVHMDKSLMPKSYSSHDHWYSSIVDSFKSENPTSFDGNKILPSILYTYDNAFHGFSAVLSADELVTLKKSPVENSPLVYNKTFSACNSTAALETAPDAIIICDDTVPIRNQISYIIQSGLLGAIFITNNPEIRELGYVVTPSVVVNTKDGRTVIEYALKSENPTVSINFQQTLLNTKPAPAAAFYTSRGPSKSYPGILKPDIMAPGSLVLAAWVPKVAAGKIGFNVNLPSNYNLISGTSMACPHASGVAALLKGAHPEWSAAAIRSALMTTANPLDNTGNPILDDGDNFNFASPLAMGAGHIDPNGALDPGLIYDATPQEYVNLLCSTNFTRNQILSITRSHAYDCSKPSSDLNYPSFIALYNNHHKTKKRVQTFQRTVTNVGDGAARYRASVTAPMGSQVTVSPEILIFAYKYEKQSFTVTLNFNAKKKGNASSGALVWIEQNGKYTVRSPIVLGKLHNGIPWVLTVAAGTIDRSFGGALTFGNGLTITGFTLFPANSLVENSQLVYNKTFSACNSTAALETAPYAIIICDDTVPIRNQISHIIQSGLLGAIFITNNPEIRELGHVATPSVVVNTKDGRTVIEYALKSENPTVSINFQQTLLNTKPAPAAAFYTSRGPSKSYPGILKPDIMAPGSLVLAAWVPKVAAGKIGFNVNLPSNYNLISGTSMACPHASGVAALLKGAHPEWSAAAIRSALMTTANPLDNTGNPILDDGDNFNFASPLAMGAGHIDPNRALDPGLIYDATPQEYVNLLCSTNFTRNQILSITRSHAYDCSKPSSDLNYPSFIALYNNHHKTKTRVQTFQRTVTNVGDGAARYMASVIAPKGSQVTVSPEILIFAYKYEKQSFTVTINFNAKKKGNASAGALVWIEQNGKYTVRSPIVVSPLHTPIFIYIYICTIACEVDLAGYYCCIFPTYNIFIFSYILPHKLYFIILQVSSQLQSVSLG
ncbi:unnamed protein product [Malus baccata var. baccata]